jgi:hypothetical protein
MQVRAFYREVVRRLREMSRKAARSDGIRQVGGIAESVPSKNIDACGHRCAPEQDGDALQGMISDGRDGNLHPEGGVRAKEPSAL